MSKIRNTVTDGGAFQTVATGVSIAAGFPVGPFVGPGFIEAQERAGQREIVEAAQLPSDMGGNRAVFERMGIKFIGATAGDPMFTDAQLPAGWKKRATGHSMWSELIDERGNVRAAIFYKAAFYDRSAHMSPRTRFQIVGRDFNDGREHRAYVIDHGADAATGAAPAKDHVIFDVGPVTCGGYKDHKTYDAATKQVWETAAAWLDARYPDWRLPCAHWDAPRMPAVCALPPW